MRVRIDTHINGVKYKGLLRKQCCDKPVLLRYVGLGMFASRVDHLLRIHVSFLLLVLLRPHPRRRRSTRYLVTTTIPPPAPRPPWYSLDREHISNAPLCLMPLVSLMPLSNASLMPKPDQKPFSRISPSFRRLVTPTPDTCIYTTTNNNQ